MHLISAWRQKPKVVARLLRYFMVFRNTSVLPHTDYKGKRLQSCDHDCIQGPPYLLERLTKLELGVAGSIFKIQPSKFQHQNNFLRYFGVGLNLKIEPATLNSSFVNRSKRYGGPCIPLLKVLINGMNAFATQWNMVKFLHFEIFSHTGL